MPELPEVEATRRWLEGPLVGRRVRRVLVRERRLRRPIPRGLEARLPGRRVEGLSRRGKYLLLRTDGGTLLVHLGMSGNLRYYPRRPPPPERHDHLEIVFEGDGVLRLHDPRRFGLALFTAGPPERHPLLAALGPEPLSDAFTPDVLGRALAGRRAPIAALLLDGRLVAGVGNIYAAEALHAASIHPLRAGGRIGAARVRRLVAALRAVLLAAIEEGGTTLRDHLDPWGRPGRFAAALAVYGREGRPCRRCRAAIRRRVRSGRSVFYCPRCQR